MSPLHAKSPARRPVVVLGNGQIGASVALLCAASGAQVTLAGRSLASLQHAQAEMRRYGRELSLLRPELEQTDWQAGVSLAVGAQLDAALRSCGIVLEAIAENVNDKSAALAHCQALAPDDAIFASSTSGLAVRDLAKDCKDPRRVAVAHFANPPHLMPLVELVPGPDTASETLRAIAQFLEMLGKETVTLRRDVPGHIFNRLQFALLREAMALVRDGVATPGQVDKVVKRGMALRLAEEGPMEKMDLASLSLVRDVATYLFPDLDAAQSPMLLDDMLAKGLGGATSGAGFFEWTEATSMAARHRRNAEIIAQLKKSPTLSSA